MPPEPVTLAPELRAISDSFLAQLERLAAGDLHADAVEDGTTGTIEEIPAEYSAARILGSWRATERALELEVPGSAQARDLERRAAVYRLAHQRAYEAARKS